jgi:hypothetical protein
MSLLFTAIGIATVALAREHEPRAIGRPADLSIVEGPGGELLGLLRGHVHDPDVIMPIVEIARTVALEAVAVRRRWAWRGRLERVGLPFVGSGSLEITAMREPSGDQSYSATPPLRLVRRTASPPARSSSQSWPPFDS